MAATESGGREAPQNGLFWPCRQTDSQKNSQRIKAIDVLIIDNMDMIKLVRYRLRELVEENAIIK